MGGNLSTQQVLSETLNKVALEAMTRNSTTVDGSINQNNELDIIGNTDKVNINGFKQVSSSKINVSALAQSAAKNTLQADMISSLKSAVDQAVPSIAFGSTSQQQIHNTITNSINSKINVENLNNIAAKVKQSNTVKLVANAGVDAKNLIQKNEADLILSLVNDATSEIVAKVASTTSQDTTASSKADGILPDLGLGGGLIFILIILGIIIGGGYYLSTMSYSDMISKPVPMAVIAAIAISLFGGLAYALSSSGDSNNQDDKKNQ